MNDMEKLIIEQCDALGITIDEAGKENKAKPFPIPKRGYIRTFYSLKSYGKKISTGMSLARFNEELKKLINTIPEIELATAHIQFGSNYDGIEYFQIKTKRQETDEEMINRWNKERQKVINYNNCIIRT